IINTGKGYEIWIFKGRLGSGKTTLIKAILKQLGVEDIVNSPSYAIINEYSSINDHTIYHFDFFRLKDIYEAFDIGVEEYLDSGNMCLIEWPEIVEPMLPDRFFEITIDNPKHEERIFKLKKHG
ncbi:tRNA (adenosine(37)-N6)-threonylcarbamoyltransferase complex ATPase subunit type 1 TsaE, partial [Bacteroidota bacterium]